MCQSGGLNNALKMREWMITTQPENFIISTRVIEQIDTATSGPAQIDNL